MVVGFVAEPGAHYAPGRSPHKTGYGYFKNGKCMHSGERIGPDQTGLPEYFIILRVVSGGI